MPLSSILDEKYQRYTRYMRNIVKVKHGLPEKVVFCKKCVMSNQRPSTSVEFNKKSSEIETAGFKDGVCDTCHWFETKKSIDWSDREKELRELCDRYRRDDGRYDVIVPGSGGKDSIYVSHLLKYEYGMNPLTVTWAPHMYTEIGWKNFNSWLRVGLDNILVTPNPKVHAVITRLALENLVNPFQPFIIGQKIAAPRVAIQYDVPLIIYGENQAECHNTYDENLIPIMDPSHYSRDTKDAKLYFGGVSIPDLYSGYEISEKDLQPYLPLWRDEVEEKKINIHYMSYYKNWSPQNNFFYSKEVSEFESNPAGRSEGTYSKYASLDDRVDGQHYFTMFIKFGQGRATNDACRDIRDGYINRSEGVALVKKYDSEFPKLYFQDFLKYIDISEERYWEVINGARSDHLWENQSNEWVLRCQVEDSVPDVV